jgi:hypothetical protein
MYKNKTAAILLWKADRKVSFRHPRNGVQNTQAATNIDALQNRERIQREEEEQENVGG